MNLLYRLAADLIVVVHFAYVAFVVVGLLAIFVGIALRWPWARNLWLRSLHLLAIVIVVAEAVWGITCPLTTWEKQLRLLAGQANYRGDFIASWVHDALFYDAQPWVFTVCYALFGLLVLATFVLAPPRLPRRAAKR